MTSPDGQLPFRVALTADFYDENGAPQFDDLGLGLFDGHRAVQVTRLREHRPEIGADQLDGCHGVIVLAPRVTADSLANSDDLLAIGRFGVGFDNVDVTACSDNDVLAMITSGAVDRPVAEATIGWMIALTHHMLAKDRLVRAGAWNERTQLMGCELRSRTLGVIGLGGIGRTLVSLLKGFGMSQPLVFDPFVSPESAEELGVRVVELNELLAASDFVSIHCPLNEDTRGLIGAKEIGLMKQDAYLLNTARGGIVDEDALFDALRERHIAGAAIDCFENEPVVAPHRFGQLDNVILAPHCIAWTAELFRDIGRVACQGMLDLHCGRRPAGVLNPTLLQRESFRAKWSRVTGIAKPSLGNLQDR